MVAILNLIAVYEDGHVLAKLALIVQYVAARLVMRAEVMVERLAHACARYFAGGALDVALDIAGESYGWHA